MLTKLFNDVGHAVAEVLSLYEKEDFEKNGTIDWDRYLLPATVFESNTSFLEALPGLSGHGDKKDHHPKYYYAFTSDFPEHPIDKNKLVSYKSFLSNSD